ncbi:tRNA uridine-5-carboxymethylaminomethyl(34) synthesis enzyme MnmG [Sphingomonas japonica]
MNVDVIVIGGGHAGVEAAAVAARRGARVALVTFDAETIGAMSCNPAIGGIGKGHLVREVDAFGGIIARAADAAAIHYRMLNRSKGSAVHGPRVQADRARFAIAVRKALGALEGVKVIEGEAVALQLRGGEVAGVELADRSCIAAKTVVIASGTFLGGRMFCGEHRSEGGRAGERAATRLGRQLRDFGLPIGRLKTGTPPRLDGRTIDWGRLSEQPSDAQQWTMAHVVSAPRLPQIACAITRTTQRTHDIIRLGLDRSPLFGGDIAGQGPRYCPSIEDKIVRFGDRDGHQLFLEPEGLDTPLVYPNGLSTSLPLDIQAAAISSIAGLERATIVAPGYAVEYDFLDPRSLDATLMSRAYPGLFCAGQINGTTGYEEAAGQGLIAGINAAAHALGLESYRPSRRSSYLGVMIDDLVLQGVSEPYRMLTSRAEYRLRLRADNAPTRLGPDAVRLGCLAPADAKRHSERQREFDRIRAAFAMETTAVELAGRGVQVALDGARRSAADWLRFPNVSAQDVLSAEMLEASDPALVDEAVTDARYAPYLARQDLEVAALERDQAATLDPALDYRGIPGLSKEMVERLTAVQPTTMADASRIRGITPAALTTILLHSKRAAA